MSEVGRASRAKPQPQRHWCGPAVPAVFVIMAAILSADVWPYSNPVLMPTTVPASATDSTPVRKISFRPEITLAGMTYRCSECHDLFPSPSETDRPLTQHQNIKREHGINNRCFNCHHRTNREAYADDKGDPIPYNQPQILCAKCHGPVYRDWLHGVHGRSNGYWNPKYGRMERLKCVECHDPHSPAFTPMAPAPGPNTLRMGSRQTRPEHDEESKNPLLIYQRLRTKEGHGPENGR